MISLFPGIVGQLKVPSPFLLLPFAKKKKLSRSNKTMEQIESRNENVKLQALV